MLDGGIHIITRQNCRPGELFLNHLSWPWENKIENMLGWDHALPLVGFWFLYVRSHCRITMNLWLIQTRTPRTK